MNIEQKRLVFYAFKNFGSGIADPLLHHWPILECMSITHTLIECPSSHGYLTSLLPPRSKMKNPNHL